MESQAKEVKQIATQLLAAMLANPHIYATVSDEGAKGQQEQELIIIAIEMAENLITRVENQK
ncbi:hypothetical protein CEN49_06770 [Fischerella thermalis CCMEE 5273]|jgi:hypothetical protein|uniref:Uncharacterized protein n=1 Tax=Fischerella thermalis JSC-11 TaxID=741277 RepID=G6FTU8_9CYAN|nr:hypothetical protein [Fischerella thermalis]PLZ98911.1 hypothetical protein CI592_19800 [Fischerella thermalis CCMEE 5328]PMB09365.1 hypothetical protein CEN49_06770 [Fischerella thermalis CCMEE 5273]EHC14031.1 hypothetical protein FJSC11DRAFT_2295 [Fischerella thermalis JSC-11]MBF1988475.1 hypothetical protein [Fischerella thermalis M58_A2018_009]MBF2058775.1 hypothetical protein [Fischerella thermalis M66_A2018_004]